jgi:cyanophycinase
MSKKNKGPLIVIGGHEEIRDRDEREILKEVARCAGAGKGAKRGLVIVTVATQLPESVGADYVHAFRQLGVGQVDVLDIRTREEAFHESNLKKLSNACVIYFTGGDQLRITSQIGGTPVFKRMLEIHEQGGVIAGTSAGAACVPETMLISGDGEQAPNVASLGMAPGLGLLKGVVVDSHFAERGRIGRLLGAVAQNPYNLGIGIDENTGILVEDETRFRVLGTGAVYVIDGRRISYSSLSEENQRGSMSIHNLTLHVLARGDEYDLAAREPLGPKDGVARRKKDNGEATKAKG